MSYRGRIFTLIGLAMGECVLGLSACAAGRWPTAGWQRPLQLVGEWIDVSKSTPTDTSLWILRENGYDGTAHLRVARNATGTMTASRDEVEYGAWYFDGTLGDTAHQSLCVSRRIGRFGATCTAFVMDTVGSDSARVRRLRLRGYRGQHHTSDRVLVARALHL